MFKFLCKLGFHNFKANHKRLPDQQIEMDLATDGRKVPLTIENFIIGKCICTRCGKEPGPFYRD